ncbi:MAG: recombination protein O N-terminal domain-containing protein [Patescibacteria group bacterium]
MREFITSAVILKREPRGEWDERITFFSRQVGKMAARTVSSRKILSKLSPHLEPGNITTIRLIEKNDLSIVDALKERKVVWELVNFSHLARLLSDHEADPELWRVVANEPSWRIILRLLGWDPEEARCDSCEAALPRYFDLMNQHFFCDRCYAFGKEKDTMIVVE